MGNEAEPEKSVINREVETFDQFVARRQVDIVLGRENVEDAGERDAQAEAFLKQRGTRTRATMAYLDGLEMVKLGRCEEALSSFEASSKEFSQKGELLDLGHVVFWTGIAYERLGHPSRAEECYKFAVQVVDEIEEKSSPVVRANRAMYIRYAERLHETSRV